jgi:hypothetical protein
MVKLLDGGGAASEHLRARCSLIYDRSDFRPELGNSYRFIKPIQRISNLLAVKQLLNMVSYFIVLLFLSELCKSLLRKCLQGTAGGPWDNMLMQARGRYTEYVWELIYTKNMWDMSKI